MKIHREAGRNTEERNPERRRERNMTARNQVEASMSRAYLNERNLKKYI